MILMDEAQRRRFALALLILSTLAHPAHVMAAAAGAPAAVGATPQASGPEAQFAAEIGAIAKASDVSRSKKQRQISDRVRSVLEEAISPRAEPGEAMAAVLRFTVAACEAAPEYVETIANAVTFAPSVKALGLSPSRVRAAAYASAKQPRSPAVAALAASSAVSPAPTFIPSSAGNMAGMTSAEPPGTMSFTTPDDPFGKNTAFTFSAVAAARYDDNVFISHTNKVDETILTFTPGVDFRFGQQSLIRGLLGYKASLTHYVNGSADDTTLSSANGNVSYQNDRVSLSGAATYQQIEQNTSDVAILNPTALIRQNILAINTNVDGRISGRMGFQTGANYSDLDYKTSQLIGNEAYSFPMRLTYETSPRLKLTGGATYGTMQLDNGGPASRDWYYNVGMHGEFTRDLSGQFSVGYRSRKVGDTPSEDLWGFDGALHYAYSEKTALDFIFSRDFSAGAQGESLTNSNYALRASFDPAPQWQFGANLAYRSVEYGELSFLSSNFTRQSINRNDDYWETGLVTTYLFNRWFSTSLNVTARHNASNLEAVEFSNRIIGLSFTFRY